MFEGVSIDHIVEYMIGIFNVILSVFNSDFKIEVNPEVEESIKNWIDEFKK